MPSNRADLMKAIKQDYPTMPDFMIETVLDVYEKDPDYIENWIKEEKKRLKTNRPPQPKTQLTIEEFERLHANDPKPEN